MGVRGELFSTKVALQNRTYFFNVKENRLGDLYLNIVESKNRDEGGFERQSVILFAEDLQEFLRGFDESLRVLEKAAREKRRGAPNKKERPPAREKRQDEDDGDFNKPRRSFKSKKFDEDSPARGSRSSERPQWENNDDSGRDSPRFQDRPRRPGSFGKDRKDSGGIRDRKDSGGPENRRSRFGNKDRENRPDSYRSGDKRDSAPRKKRVVVKKY